MKIIRTLIGEFTKEDVSFLQSYGIDVPENQLKRFYLDENENYYVIFDYLADRLKKTFEYQYEKAKNNQNRLFEYSIADIKQSNYCKFQVPIGGGYPQPENNYGYCHLTYDGSMCHECALPMNQVNNFRVTKVSKRPIWGFTAWVHDAIFVQEDIYRDIFAPLGIQCRPVEKSSGKKRDGIMQLDLPITNESLIPPVFYDELVCPVCGLKRYWCWGSHPYFPEPLSSNFKIFLTKEIYGNGWDNAHNVIISTDLALKLLELKAIKLDNLIPCRKDFELYFRSNPDLVPTRMNLVYDFKRGVLVHK